VSCSSAKRAGLAEQKVEREVVISPRFSYNIYSKEEVAGAKLDGPIGVFASRGKVFVANSGQGEIAIFDSEGRFLSSFPTGSFQVPPEPGPQSPVDSYPVGVTLGSEDKIYVSDIHSQQLRVFTPKGIPAGLFPANEKKDVLTKPVGLAFNREKLFVTDVGDQSVKVFLEGGELLRKFGQPGAQKGQLLFPNGIVIRKDGTIFVADSNNSRVQVFGPTGGYLFSISEELKLPRGLAIDGLERLHVADALSRQVSVYDGKGKFLFSYGGPGKTTGMAAQDNNGESKLDIPIGIAIDESTRNIYITDKGNDCVSVWEY
jgi:DNA-binding beta-propeller fold protein YncE